MYSFLAFRCLLTMSSSVEHLVLSLQFFSIPVTSVSRSSTRVWGSLSQGYSTSFFPFPYSHCTCHFSLGMGASLDDRGQSLPEKTVSVFCLICSAGQWWRLVAMVFCKWGAVDGKTVFTNYLCWDYGSFLERAEQKKRELHTVALGLWLCWLFGVLGA